MNIKEKAVKRVLEKKGREFLDNPIALGSGVVDEMITDEKSAIRREDDLPPKKLSKMKRPERRKFRRKVVSGKMF